ncbi:MAG TPA: helix-turn-helix transcriptional regulator [Herpetosiphonaceae bacterium]
MTIDQELNARIGAAIRNARLARGVTQDDLAALLQVDRTMISRYERGSRTISAPALLRMFHYLEYSLNTLDLGAASEDASSTSLAAMPEPIQRIVTMLQQRPELIGTVEDVLETFLGADETT